MTTPENELTVSTATLSTSSAGTRVRHTTMPKSRRETTSVVASAVTSSPLDAIHIELTAGMSKSPATPPRTTFIATPIGPNQSRPTKPAEKAKKNSDADKPGLRPIERLVPPVAMARSSTGELRGRATASGAP